MRKKRIGLLLLAVLFWSVSLVVLAEEQSFVMPGEVIRDGTIYKITEDKAIIVGFVKDAEETVIPFALDGKPVSVEIRESSLCPPIKKLVIGEGFLSFADRMFLCLHIEELVLPSSLQKISSCAFESVTGLRTLTLPKGLQTIDEYAFAYTDIEQIILSDTVLRVSDTAFLECKALKAYIVDEGNPVYTAIDGALYSKDGKTLYDYPRGKGDTWTVPAGTMEIADYALKNKKLLSLRIGEGMEFLGENVLSSYYCDIGEVYLPASLRAIEEKAFGYQGPTNIEVAEDNPNFYCDGYALYQKDDQTLLRFYNKDAAQYDVLPGTKRIAAWAFADNAFIQSVTLPCGVQSIGNGAFDGCVELQNVLLPITLTSIEKNAFYNCDALERLVLPQNLQSIGNFAFESCHSLVKLNLPDSLKYIDEYAFSHCKNLMLYANEGTYGAKYINAHPDRKDYSGSFD